MVKSPSQKSANQSKKDIEEDKIEDVVSKLADKPYGKEVAEKNKDTSNIANTKNNEMANISISIPLEMSYKLDDMARERKRKKLKNRTVSSIVREALGQYLDV